MNFELSPEQEEALGKLENAAVGWKPKGPGHSLAKITFHSAFANVEREGVPVEVAHSRVHQARARARNATLH